ncbi:AMP-binding protein [Azorhizobium doebereinerae]|uniref:AMP-binding protein n=1 Tax=Azorhizobium doebereinerae TaxID=281091 RepID=UPI00040973AC|nr:AMP-binding protein [Azorhizobium doebereinerae]
MNLALWLERAGRECPEAAAVGHGTAVHQTYETLAGRAARLARALREGLGVPTGGRVAVIAKNMPQYLEILYGIWLAGAAAVPVNAKLHGAEFGYILEHSGAGIAFVSPDVESAIAPFAPDSLRQAIVIGSPAYEALFAAEPLTAAPRDDGDLAWLFYTSGTTGRPKGALLSHGNLAAMSYAYAAEVDPIAPGDVLYHGAPMSHGSGLYIMAHVMRRAVSVVPESGAFEPDEMLGLAAHWGRTSLFAAPTMVKRLVASGIAFDPARLRSIVYGGGPMYVEDTIAALDAFGDHLVQIYGQGETPMTITTLGREDIANRRDPRWREKLGSVGRPFAMLDVALVDGQGRPAAPGETGEIICRGPTVMSGYWNDPDATARALKGGWLHTGDMGVMDDAGYLTLKDRSKDLIISGGTNIYPREVEEVLLTHAAVQEVSVIGRPDPEWGEVVVAYVVGTAPEGELDALCLSRIARFKRPKQYVFVEALPKNNYGKVVKTELRQRDARAQQRAGAA